MFSVGVMISSSIFFVGVGSLVFWLVGSIPGSPLPGIADVLRGFLELEEVK